jgi:hypothetical protein
MTARSKLLWWLVVNLSVALTAFGVYSGHAANIIATDTTFLALGLVVSYFVMTVWTGWAVHFGGEFPEKWVNWMIGVMPALGLIGTFVGIIELFVSGGGAIENEAVFRGVGTALYVVLCAVI